MATDWLITCPACHRSFTTYACATSLSVMPPPNACLRPHATPDNNITELAGQQCRLLSWKPLGGRLGKVTSLEICHRKPSSLSRPLSLSKPTSSPCSCFHRVRSPLPGPNHRGQLAVCSPACCRPYPLLPRPMCHVSFFNSPAGNAFLPLWTSIDPNLQ